MRSHLFIKIFFGFWLVTIAILGSWGLSTHYFESRPGAETLEHRPPGPPQRFMLGMIYQLQNLDDADIPPLLEQAQEDHGVEILLLDNNGNDIYQRTVPAAAQLVAEQLQKGGRRRAVTRTPQGVALAHNIYRSEQGPLQAVFLFQHPRHRLLGALGSNLWLRICLVILVSGLVCYGLSRIMTKRLKALQLASRRLANGDLDTRLQVRVKGGDETDELARDFNSMAGQLQQRIQAQKRLLADVSHELRSPLARLRIALALAEQDQANSAQHLQRIEGEAERLEELIAQLLSSQAGNAPLDTHIDLVPLLQQLCSDANFEAQAQGKQVNYQHSVAQAVVASTGDLLHKSFENVLRNAIGHTSPDSQVRVTLDQKGAGFCIRIEDQGAGIAEEELERIFDEFYRVDTARSRESGGYGLGLAIARRAIEHHGGQIRAQNTGTGLAVSIELPASL